MISKYVLIVSIASVASVLVILGLIGTGSIFSDRILESQNQLAQNAIKETGSIRHIVPLNEIRNEGVPRDGIPPLDFPKYVKADEADFLSDRYFVIGLKHEGETKAYPLNIMVWHEIVNDEFGDTPVAITFCPLCFTSQVFDRGLDGVVLEFGNTGNLYKSNLVMYDRNTESQWSQSMATAITGELAGKKLRKIPFEVMSWKDWKSLYPETKVLSIDTGYSRPYNSNPYSKYFSDGNLVSPVGNLDERMHPKMIVVGLESNNEYKAYLQPHIENSTVINDSVGSKNVLLFSKHPFQARVFDREIDNRVLSFEFENDSLKDIQTDSVWNFEGTAVSGPLEGAKLKRLALDQGFWFEWAAIHPSTEIYDPDK